MALSIEWSRMAHVDMIGIGDPSVIAELITIAESDLDTLFLPTQTQDQGTAQAEPPPGVAWRRGIKNKDALFVFSVTDEEVDLNRYRACDYVLVYRPPTRDEALAAAAQDGRKCDYVVDRVLPGTHFAQQLTPEIAERALQLGDLWTQFMRELNQSISEG